MIRGLKAEVVANCDHLQNLKLSKALPFAFTEHGAIQAANVLASSQAVEMGIYVVRAFVQLRQSLSANADIAQRLAEIVFSIFLELPAAGSNPDPKFSRSL
jgi:hypothetical protein